MRGWFAGGLLVLVMTTRAGAGDGPPIDDRATRAPALVDIVALDPTIRLDVRYATADNVAGRKLYPAARAFLQRPAAEALVRVHRALAPEGLGLIVFDAYRPWRVTQTLWDVTPPERREFVADPALGSRHNRGCAADVTLFDRTTGKAVAMPSEFDDFSDRARPTYTGGTPEARANRERLRAAMEREGFFVHPSEWWHYDYKDWAEYPILDVAFDAVGTAKAAATAPPAAPDLVTARVVDLTHPFDAETLYWPTAKTGFVFDRLSWGRTPGGFFYSANAFCAPEHGGTHLDAPIHFAEGHWTADAIPVDRLLGPGVVIDVTAKVEDDRDYRLTVDDVRRFEQAHGAIPTGAYVLLRTGWDVYWPNRGFVFGDDTPGRTTDLHFPSYGKDAAAMLVRDRRVAALGVDTPSIDHGPSQDFPVHRVVAAANVMGMENVDNLEALPPTGAWIVALPMKIGGGSGGPLRIVALLAP